MKDKEDGEREEKGERCAEGGRDGGCVCVGGLRSVMMGRGGGRGGVVAVGWWSVWGA